MEQRAALQRARRHLHRLDRHAGDPLELVAHARALAQPSTLTPLQHTQAAPQLPVTSPTDRAAAATELHPRIERDYGTAASGHGLFGYSYGGLFALYAWLREADTVGAERVLIEAVPEEGLGCAVMDRVRRAAQR